MAQYISDGVGVNSINDEDVIPEGWSVITAKAAEGIYPPLFGGDPVEALAVIDPIETPAEPVEAPSAPVEPVEAPADATPDTK